jgi:S1-C subfamily serine protease
MKRVIVALVAGLVVGLAATSHADVQRPPAPSLELNTLLMHATFLIFGPNKTDIGKQSFGTLFAMALPKKDDPKEGSLVLVTAAHVLNDIGGDEATLLVRRKQSDGTYDPFQAKIAIRKNNIPLYVAHPMPDVAVMYGDIPNVVFITGVTPEFLADDKRLEDVEVHPGDEIMVLGFPLAATLPGGFPVLRSARIASYPMTPAKNIKGFVVDLFLYPGNSGGPAYFTFVNRIYKGNIHLGVEQGILGLVIQESRSSLPEFKEKSLNLGVIVPAVFIRETIDLLVNDTTGTLKPYN